jgi:hypothetical protein
MFPWGCNDNLLKREIEKMDDQNTLLIVPCNILPSLIKKKWLKKNINYISIQEAFNDNIKNFIKTNSLQKNKKITIIGGTHVSNKETSIYLQNDENVLSHYSVNLIDQKKADTINDTMLRVLSKDFDSANKSLFLVLKEIYQNTDIFVIASTSISLLREHNNGQLIDKDIIEIKESKLVDSINKLPVLDTLKHYADYVARQITIEKFNQIRENKI